MIAEVGDRVYTGNRCHSLLVDTTLCGLHVNGNNRFEQNNLSHDHRLHPLRHRDARYYIQQPEMHISMRVPEAQQYCWNIGVLDVPVAQKPTALHRFANL